MRRGNGELFKLFFEVTQRWVEAGASRLRPGGWFCVEVQDMHVSRHHSHALSGQTEMICMGTHARIALWMEESGLLLKQFGVWDRGRHTGWASRLTCAPGSLALATQHSNLIFSRKPGGAIGSYSRGDELSDGEKAVWARSIWMVSPSSDSKHPARCHIFLH